MIGLAFWATAINYLDRQTLSVAAPVLSEEFHMTDVDYSRVTTAFLFAYTIMNGVSGPLIDRLGTKLGYGLCVLWWSVAAMLHALSRGAFSLGAWRFARRRRGGQLARRCEGGRRVVPRARARAGVGPLQ